MTNTSVFETLNGIKWGLRKCCFAPQPPPKSGQANAISVFPASQELGRVASTEFSEACISQQSTPLQSESAASILGLIHGHMVLCHIVVT